MDLGALFKGRSKTPILAALIVVLLCGSLSYWQWQRAQQKHVLQQKIENKKAQNVTNEQQVTAQPLTQYVNAEVSITGSFVDGAVWYLDNQVVKGRVGFDVIGILKIAETDEYLAVNLGFVPQQASRVPTAFSPPAAIVSLPVYIKSSANKRFTLAKSAADEVTRQPVIQYIDINYLSAELNKPLLPLIAYMTQNKLAGTDPHYQPVVMSPQKHEAYAVQWLLIAFAAMVIGWKLSKKENKNV
ncbi:SURF1 family protein [Pseudoalteromonas piscicida]|uniref:SURF1-like protein n=1 Tax=Pseudoalteromonas piscicida TaxID=43662 RepID=A0AAD0W2G4_PSEO7|nr:SURF1 family protein [Pseudoalteromonas piscicida]ASD65881.1 cytochrome oxidase biogenesis protein [Pseudoalteromonas piscicida]AXQ99318.1 SURF1 family protein [Pseudoalteromonas piscicida]AXR00920.1 SURF1 family protein [Pseudoalteromonas piscicida]